MGEEEKTLNPIYRVPEELEEEILLRMPLKSILRFKTVSKRWRSILESRSFAERRMKAANKNPKILAVGDQSRFKLDAGEIDVVCLGGEAAKRPSLTCEGLVCIPVPGCVNILNPSTEEYISFPTGTDPVTTRFDYIFFTASWWNIFPGCCAMGFGKDEVNGDYKVVRMFFDPIFHCEILNVSIGEWKLIKPPPYRVDPRRKSVYLNGSIYWLEMLDIDSILALDLHTEEFRDVPVPPESTDLDQIVNLENRLAIAIPGTEPDWTLVLWTLDAQEKTWTLTYTIRLRLYDREPYKVWFRPVAVCKEGNLLFCDNKKRLFKYYPKTNSLSCISSDICVISDFAENLVSLRPSSLARKSDYLSGYHYEYDDVQDNVQGSQLIEKFRWIKKRIPSILITTTVVSAVIFRYFSVSSASRP
ncbi:unnamed protein product [Eruca vesicaria subsp. sativa]|uniref:F-box domain-containing protein n=1 Tax=Eruca vesicaria subsp. sativa TaxID=29727 RepID=A0ABC8K7C4_ERUVS|nr:unnamed protein product [Eruca vesicaria subsp. sativa]